MKFTWGKRKQLREIEAELHWEESKDWHLWFAWYPVKVIQDRPSLGKDYRIFEYVWRRNIATCWDDRFYIYEYLPREKTPFHFTSRGIDPKTGTKGPHDTP